MGSSSEWGSNYLDEFEKLIDITDIDYPSREHRFEVIYLLLSLKLNKRILVKTSIKIDNNFQNDSL